MPGGEKVEATAEFFSLVRTGEEKEEDDDDDDGQEEVFYEDKERKRARK